MRTDDFKHLSARDQELLLLLGRIARALEALAEITEEPLIPRDKSDRI